MMIVKCPVCKDERRVNEKIKMALCRACQEEMEVFMHGERRKKSR